jgi:RsiW-degrading membrane proteinase PrsW (M82 family)
MVGLIAVSAMWLGFRLFGTHTVAPAQASAALFSWSGYAALLTAIVVKLARKVRPPVWAAVLAVLWGGAAAAFAQLFALATRDAIADSLGPSRAAWISALAAPLPEEVFKAVGVVLLMMSVSPLLRSPLCGMVLGALVGIGFNAAEGLVFSVSEIAKSGSWEPLWSDLLVRGLLTGLVTHAGLTAIVGAGIGYLSGADAGARTHRIGLLAALLLVAIALHTLINSPLLDDWGVGGVVVKEIPVAVAASFVGDRSRSEEVRRQRSRRASPATTD